MSSKIARNAPCPCGSGKKYKVCHGSVADTGEANLKSVVMRYDFSSIILTPLRPEAGQDGRRIVVNGALSHDGVEYPFMMIVQPQEAGEYVIEQFGWSNAPPIADKEAVARQLLTHLNECLEPLVLKAGRGEESPQAIVWAPPKPGDDQEDAFVTVLRPRLSRLPAPAWPALWDRISLKIPGDPACAVAGFSREEVEKGMQRLQEVFTPAWLEESFKQVLGGGDTASMAGEFPFEAGSRWFPAYHLSRLAMGVICRDPALNTLVDLGLSLEELAEFEGLPALQAALAERPSLHHQACLAAELARRCIPMAAGDEPGDLRVTLEGPPMHIRTREVTLRNLVQDLREAMQPPDGRAPHVLHAVVNETSWHTPGQELPGELDGLEMPAETAALVVGRRLLGGAGGRPRRHAQRIILNPGASSPVDPAMLEHVFATSEEKTEGPALNVGSYFYVL